MLKKRTGTRERRDLEPRWLRRKRLSNDHEVDILKSKTLPGHRKWGLDDGCRTLRSIRAYIGANCMNQNGYGKSVCPHLAGHIGSVYLKCCMIWQHKIALEMVCRADYGFWANVPAQGSGLRRATPHPPRPRFRLFAAACSARVQTRRAQPIRDHVHVVGPGGAELVEC